MAVAVAVGEGGAVAVAAAGLTKRFLNHIQKDFLINVWGYNRTLEHFFFREGTEGKDHITSAQDNNSGMDFGPFRNCCSVRVLGYRNTWLTDVLKRLRRYGRRIFRLKMFSAENCFV